jgi:hypothetical protein
MNRIKTILLLFITSLITFSLASGQESKEKKSIKVIVTDNSGTKVVIDTTYTGADLSDSIIMKNGKVIYLGQNDIEIDEMPESRIEVKTHVDSDGSRAEHKYIYIKEDKDNKRSSGKTFSIIVNDNESDNEMDKTSYVIAKNGITVTIEGTDESKIKKLVEEIEKKLEKDE